MNQIKVSVFLPILLVASGCGTLRLYEGEPKAPSEVAYLRGTHLLWDVVPTAIDDRSVGNSSWYEILPGTHKVDWMFNTSDVLLTYNGRGTSLLNAEAGHKYMLTLKGPPCAPLISIRDLSNNNESSTPQKKEPIRPRYTPLEHAEQLADRVNPQVVDVGNFACAYKTITNSLAKDSDSHSSRTTNNMVIVRGAYVDAMKKSGFVLCDENLKNVQPFFKLNGEVTKFSVKISTGVNVKVVAEIAIKITVSRVGITPLEIHVEGCDVQESTSLNTGVAIPDGHDRALRECVMKLLENKDFRTYISREK